MNFSHGSYEYHQSVIDNVHKLVERVSSFYPPTAVGVGTDELYLPLLVLVQRNPKVVRWRLPSTPRGLKSELV